GRTHWTRVDRDYGRLRIDTLTLFSDLANETREPLDDSAEAHYSNVTNKLSEVDRQAARACLRTSGCWPARIGR
ncbi:hypothetical protein, partial [Streptomyces doebereineriae]